MIAAEEQKKGITTKFRSATGSLDRHISDLGTAYEAAFNEDAELSSLEG